MDFLNSLLFGLFQNHLFYYWKLHIFNFPLSIYFLVGMRFNYFHWCSIFVMKRFLHCLFVSVDNSSSNYGVQSMRGKKRMNSSSPFTLTEMKLKGNVGEELQNSASGSAETAQAPRCRPWDRGDLLRRLATFKSMTWFARPQV